MTTTQIIFTVQTENDAFRDTDGRVDMPTVALNLQDCVSQIANGRTSGFMRDSNGNRAITWETRAPLGDLL